MLLQQLSGINAIIYYAPKIFIYAGLGVNSSLFSTILVGLVNLLSSILGLLLLDKLGRRPLMIAGSLIMAVALAVVAFTLNSHMSPLESYIGVGAVLVYIFAFALSTGLFGWLIIAEIFPLSVRGEGAAIGATANWVFNIMVSFSFPIFLQSLGIEVIFGFF
jgi:SP family arabinose:H+ symporter-like MFS transporter